MKTAIFPGPGDLTQNLKQTRYFKLFGIPFSFCFGRMDRSVGWDGNTAHPEHQKKVFILPRVGSQFDDYAGHRSTTYFFVWLRFFVGITIAQPL